MDIKKKKKDIVEKHNYKMFLNHYFTLECNMSNKKHVQPYMIKKKLFFTYLKNETKIAEKTDYKIC